MRILLNYATRKRKDKFLLAIHNIEKTTITNDYKIVVKIDEDDSEMVAMNPEINRMKNTAGYIIKPFGKIAAINAYIPWYESWDVLVNFSDDFEFVHGWDSIMEQKIRSVWQNTTDYFAHFSDGFTFEKLTTMSVLGREYAERFGWVYPPMYKSFSCDAETYYVAQMLNKYHYFPEIIAYHKHPVNVKMGYDEVYKANDAHMPYDTQMYFHRMSKDFYLQGVDTSIIDKHKR